MRNPHFGGKETNNFWRSKFVAGECADLLAGWTIHGTAVRGTARAAMQTDVPGLAEQMREASERIGGAVIGCVTGRERIAWPGCPGHAAFASAQHGGEGGIAQIGGGNVARLRPVTAQRKPSSPQDQRQHKLANGVAHDVAHLKEEKLTA